MKKLKTIFIAITLFVCANVSFAGTPTYKDSAKAEVQQYVDMLKPLIDQAAAANGTKIPFENLIWFVLSLIAVGIIMYFHKKNLVNTLAASNAAHAKTTQEMLNKHAELIDKIVDKK